MADLSDYDEAYERVNLHNMEQRLAVYKQAFLVGENASSQAMVPMEPQEFVVTSSFLQVANCLLYEKVAVVEDNTLVKYIFEDMLCESIENYSAIFEILPLENLNPAVFVAYLPPGRSEQML